MCGIGKLSTSMFNILTSQVRASSSILELISCLDLEFGEQCVCVGSKVALEQEKETCTRRRTKGFGTDIYKEEVNNVVDGLSAL